MATAPAKAAGTRAPTKDWTPAPAPAASPTWTPAPAPVPPATRPGGLDERQYALFLHLSSLSYLVSIPGFIGPLVMWLIKKDQSAFIDRHGRSALDFQISLFIYVVAAVVLIGVVAVATLGIGVILLIPLIIIAALGGLVLMVVLPILAGMKASQGQDYHYPLSLRLLRPRQ